MARWPSFRLRCGLFSGNRRRFVEPRAGYVEFSLSRQNQNSRNLKWAAALGGGMLLLTLLLVVVSRRREAASALEGLISGLPAGLVALASILAGILTGARRFHVYGLVLLASAAATISLAGGPALPLVIGGLVVSLSGATLLVRFLEASRRFLDHP